MDLFKIIEKLISSDSPVILIFSLILIYLFHKFLIAPKIDAILQNTEESKAIQDIDKIKEFVTDKNNVINEKVNMLTQDMKDISEKLTELIIIINHINENIVKKFEIATDFSDNLKQLLDISNQLMNNMNEIHETSISNNKDIKSIAKNLSKAIFVLNEIVKRIEDTLIEIRAENKEDQEYLELVKKKQEIEEKLRKKKEALSYLTSRFSTNLYTYIDESNLLTDEDIENLLKNNNSKE